MEGIQNVSAANIYDVNLFSFITRQLTFLTIHAHNYPLLSSPLPT